MTFAQWFRPMVFLALTTCTHILLISAFQADLSVFLAFRKSTSIVKSLHDLMESELPLLSRLKLTWTICWFVYSAFLALAIQLIITAGAWFKFSKKSSAACLVAAGLSVSALLVRFE